MKKTIKRLVGKLSKYFDIAYYFEYINYLLQRRKSGVPIFIYQMGKVGSATVYNSIKRSGAKCPLFHVHFLDEKNISEIETAYKNSDSGIVPFNIKRSRIIRNFVKDAKAKYYISIIREPMGRYISDYFQIEEDFYAKLSEKKDDGKLSAIEKVIKDKISGYKEEEDFYATWFDKEFKIFTGVDIFEHYFDKEKGYTILENPGCKILLLRMEDINRVLSDAISDLTEGRIMVSVKNRNIRSNEKNASEYHDIRNALKIDERELDKIYSSKVVSYFYTDKEIEEFKGKWEL